MKNTDFSAEAKPRKASKHKSSKWKIVTAAVVAVALLFVGVVYLTAPEKGGKDDMPPAVGVAGQEDGSTFQGLMMDKRTVLEMEFDFIVFDEDDNTKWKDSDWNSKGLTHSVINSSEGVHSISLSREMTLQEIIERWEPTFDFPKDKYPEEEYPEGVNPEDVDPSDRTYHAIALIYFDSESQKFITPENDFWIPLDGGYPIEYVSKEDLANYTLSKGQTIMIASLGNPKVYELNDSSKSEVPNDEVIDFCSFSKKDTWVNGAVYETTPEKLLRGCTDRAASVWVESDWYIYNWVSNSGKEYPIPINYKKIRAMDETITGYYNIWVQFGDKEATRETPPAVSCPDYDAEQTVRNVLDAIADRDLVGLFNLLTPTDRELLESSLDSVQAMMGYIYLNEYAAQLEDTSRIAAGIVDDATVVKKLMYLARIGGETVSEEEIDEFMGGDYRENKDLMIMVLRYVHDGAGIIQEVSKNDVPYLLGVIESILDRVEEEIRKIETEDAKAMIAAYEEINEMLRHAIIETKPVEGDENKVVVTIYPHPEYNEVMGETAPPGTKFEFEMIRVEDEGCDYWTVEGLTEILQEVDAMLKKEKTK